MDPFSATLLVIIVLAFIWAGRFTQSIRRRSVKKDLHLSALTQMELHHPPTSRWRRIGDGIEELTLNEGLSGRRTLLQRYAPGGKTLATGGPIRHTFYEEVYLVSGTITDVGRGETLTEGAYAYRHPGMPHGPYESCEGCLMLVLCTEP